MNSSSSYNFLLLTGLCLFLATLCNGQTAPANNCPGLDSAGVNCSAGTVCCGPQTMTPSCIVPGSGKKCCTWYASSTQCNEDQVCGGDLGSGASSDALCGPAGSTFCDNGLVINTFCSTTQHCCGLYGSTAFCCANGVGCNNVTGTCDAPTASSSTTHAAKVTSSSSTHSVAASTSTKKATTSATALSTSSSTHAHAASTSTVKATTTASSHTVATSTTAKATSTKATTIAASSTTGVAGACPSEAFPSLVCTASQTCYKEPATSVCCNADQQLCSGGTQVVGACYNQTQVCCSLPSDNMAFVCNMGQTCEFFPQNSCVSN